MAQKYAHDVAMGRLFRSFPVVRRQGGQGGPTRLQHVVSEENVRNGYEAATHSEWQEGDSLTDMVQARTHRSDQTANSFPLGSVK